MSEYIVERVSQDKPREWVGPHGTVYYIKTMLVGHAKPVSIGKKNPDALKAGEKVWGSIETTDLPEDKFKSEQRPQGSFASAGQVATAKYGRNDEHTQESIARSVALKAAVDIWSGGTIGLIDKEGTVLKTADIFLAWLQGNSGSEGANSPTTAVSRQTTNEVQNPAPAATEHEDDAAIDSYINSFGGEDINPDEIPF